MLPKYVNDSLDCLQNSGRSIEPKQRLLLSIQRRMLKILDHVIRRDCIKKLTVQGKVDGKKIKRRYPVVHIDQIKNLTHMSVAKIVRTAADMEHDDGNVRTVRQSLRSTSNNDFRERDPILMFYLELRYTLFV